MVLNVGDIFGLQKILEIDIPNPNTKRHENSCMCQCIQCNKISYRPKYTIMNGNRISCSCQKSKNAIISNKNRGSVKVGKTYGFLVVKEDLGFQTQSRGRQESWYRCHCLNCGNDNYKVSGNNLVSGGCTSCGCVNSKGETLIKKIFDENNIKYQQQYTFEDLNLKGKLRFDFAVFNEQNEILFLLEFDGRQHFYGPEATWKESDSFQALKERDQLKNAYCKQYNLILKRVPFYDINKINLSNLLDDTYIFK